MANGYPKSSFILTSTTPSGEVTSKTIPYVRLPNFQAVRNFGQAVNNLTDTTLRKISVKIERTLIEFSGSSASWAISDVPFLYFDTTLDSVIVKRSTNSEGHIAATNFEVQADDTNCVTLIAENLYRIVIPVTCNLTMMSPFIGADYRSYNVKTSIAFCKDYNADTYSLVATIDTHDKSVGIPLYYETANMWEAGTQLVNGIDYSVGKLAIRLKGVDENG